MPGVCTQAAIISKSRGEPISGRTFRRGPLGGRRSPTRLGGVCAGPCSGEAWRYRVSSCFRSRLFQLADAGGLAGPRRQRIVSTYVDPLRAMPPHARTLRAMPPAHARTRGAVLLPPERVRVEPLRAMPPRARITVRHNIIICLQPPPVFFSPAVLGVH